MDEQLLKHFFWLCLFALSPAWGFLGLRTGNSKLGRLTGTLIADSSSVLWLFCLVRLPMESGPRIPGFGQPLLVQLPGWIITALGGSMLLVAIGNILPSIGLSQRPDHLVTGGLYRYVRHPIYSGSIVFYFGWCLANRSMFAFLLTPLVLLVADFTRYYEEKLLLEPKFPLEYKVYRKRTPALLPRYGWGLLLALFLLVLASSFI